MNQLPSLRRSVLPVLLLCLGASATAQSLTAPAARLSDQAISADHAAFRAAQARLKALNEQGVPLRDYQASKAQCWLDVSVHEYTRNDRSAFPQEALGQSVAIIAALEARAGTSGSAAGDVTPLVNGAAHLRPDLWARFAALKQGSGAACAAQHVACGEVELVHAGNEFNQQGWRHANPYVQIAEDHVRAATEAAAACAVASPVVVAPPVVVLPEPARPLPLAVEKLTLSADALFRFDKAALADLLPEGRSSIDAMLGRLDQVYARVDSIRVTGHTDPLGSMAYNQVLSEKRAATVMAYLTSQGARAQISSAGKGESEQIAACAATLPRAALIACLQPNRRVEIEVRGVKR